MEWSLTGLPLPIVLRPPSPLTDEELLLLSRKNRTLRIEKNAQGELIIMTPVGGQGSIWEAFVVSELQFWARDIGGGIVFGSQAGFNLPDGSTLSPDASWIPQEKWDRLTKEEQKGYPPLCPDFLIEVLSATDSIKVLRAKMQTWMDNGTVLAWMIDPYAATLTIYRQNQEPEVVQRPVFIEADAPVAGFRLTTSRLWDDPES